MELIPGEIGPLSYVTGYVLQTLYRKSKNSTSIPSQELQFLLQSLKLADTKEDEYVDFPFSVPSVGVCASFIGHSVVEPASV